jgi:hypothetical protein
MSVAYGGGPGGGYAPTGRVNFGWIGEAFELFKANIAVWLVASIMVLVVTSVIGGIIGGIFGAASAMHGTVGQPPFGSSPYGAPPFGGQRNPFNSGLPIGLNIGIQVVSLIYTSFLYGGIYRTAVKQVRGEMISVSDIFSGGSLFLSMLGFTLIYTLAVSLGTVLCIVPGLLLSGLLFPGYALIADGESLSNAISRCVDGMKKDMWNAAAFVFVMGLLIFASVFAFCLGEFVTMPMFWLVGVLAYRDMIGMPGLGAPASPYGMPPTPGYTPGVWPPPPSQTPSFGQPPPPSALPPPSFGQPPASPPRRSLGGDDLDEPGNTPPRPGGTPPQ